MPLHIAARLHALIHGLFRPSDEAETRQLHNKVAALFDRHGLHDPSEREGLITSLAAEVLSEFGVDQTHQQFRPVVHLIGRVFNYEGFFELPETDWSERRS